MSKNSTPVIRFAVFEDAEAIAINHIRSWQEMYKDFIPESILQNLSVQQRTQEWQDLINQGVKILVLEIDHKMVGFASICEFRDVKPDALNGEFSAIYLHPDHWRQGLGTQLCKIALSELSKLGFKSVYLWVLSDNLQARRFYESLGFVVTDYTRIEEFYEGGALLEEILYKKTL